MAELEVAGIDEIKDDEPKVVNIKGKAIAIFNIKGKFFAINNECPHQMGSLAHGIIKDHCISCPLHFWKFDLKTGKGIQPEGPKVECFKTKIKGSKLFIEI